MSSSDQPVSALPGIQYLRGLAAVLVALGHTLIELPRLAGFDPSYVVTLNYGFGVDLFFVISGFIMTYTASAGFGDALQQRRFMFARLARIGPLYWLVTTAFLTPRRVADRFVSEGLDLVVLLPGESFQLGGAHESTRALARYDNAFADVRSRPRAEGARIGFDALKQPFQVRRERLLSAHGRLGLKLLKPVVVRIPDLGMSALMSFRDDRFEPTDAPPDIIINSQPLQFMLANDFGLQTLGVSGRYELVGDLRNWFRHRLLMALVNAGLGLSPRRLMSRAQLGFFWKRRGDLVDQVRYRFARVFG